MRSSTANSALTGLRTTLIFPIYERSQIISEQSSRMSNRSLNRSSVNSELSSRPEPLTASALRVQTPRINISQKIVAPSQNPELRRIQLIQKQKDIDRQQLRSVSAKAKQIMTRRMDETDFAGRPDDKIIPVDLFATPIHVSHDYRPQSVMRSVSQSRRPTRLDVKPYEHPTNVRVEPPEENAVFFERYRKAALQEDADQRKQLQEMIKVQTDFQNPDIQLFKLNLETMEQRKQMLEEARFCVEIVETMKFFDGELSKLKPRILTFKYQKTVNSQIQDLREKLLKSRQLSQTYETEQKAIHTDIISKRQGMLTGRQAEQARKQQQKTEEEHKEKLLGILAQLKQYLQSNPNPLTKETTYEGIDRKDVEQLKTFEEDAGNPLLQQFLYLYQFEEAMELIHGCSKEMDSWLSETRKQIKYQALDLFLLGKQIKQQYETDCLKRLEALRPRLQTLTGTQLYACQQLIKIEEEQLQKVKTCLEVPQIRQQIVEAEKQRAEFEESLQEV